MKLLSRLAFSSLMLWLACSPADRPQADAGIDSGARPLVVATTTIIADIVQNICGDRFQVVSIMRPGEDPHIYDPRPEDARTFVRGRVVLINGLHLEGTLHDIIHNNLAPGAVLSALAEDPRIKPIESVVFKGAPDPHCWFSLPHIKVYVDRTVEALAEADPAGAAIYRENARLYTQKLDSLDAWTRQMIGSIPEDRRILVTAHDAFHYFGIEYRIEVVAVIGISTDQEPRPQDVENLVSLIQRHGVPAVFIETSVSPSLNNLVRKVGEKTGVKVGGTLYSDSLDEPGKVTGTYIGMFRHNVETIVNALK